MTKNEVYDLKDGEMLLKVNKKELSILLRTLDQARGEMENQRARYIQRNPISDYKDMISDGMGVQIEEVAQLYSDIDSGRRFV